MNYQRWSDMEKSIEANKKSHIYTSGDRFSKKEIADLMIEAKDKLPKLVSRYAKNMDIEYEKVLVKCQKTRWGSCSDRGNISLNCLLMWVPSYVRKYVIVHELAHRKIMSHSTKFWNMVAAEMPDYKKAIKWLNNNGNKLIERLSA